MLDLLPYRARLLDLVVLHKDRDDYPGGKYPSEGGEETEATTEAEAWQVATGTASTPTDAESTKMVAGVVDYMGDVVGRHPNWKDAARTIALESSHPTHGQHWNERLATESPENAALMIVDGWQSFMDSTNTRLDEAARGEFNLHEARVEDPDTMRQMEDALEQNTQSLMRDVVRAQYDRTQEHFKQAGVTHVILHRGMREEDGRFPWQDGETVETVMNPISSWTASPRVAEGFAGAGRTRADPTSGVVITARVPVEQILSVPATGMGVPTVGEVLVLGKPLQATVRRPR